MVPEDETKRDSMTTRDRQFEPETTAKFMTEPS